MAHKRRNSTPSVSGEVGPESSMRRKKKKEVPAPPPQSPLREEDERLDHAPAAATPRAQKKVPSKDKVTLTSPPPPPPQEEETAVEFMDSPQAAVSKKQKKKKGREAPSPPPAPPPLRADGSESSEEEEDELTPNVSQHLHKEQLGKKPAPAGAEEAPVSLDKEGKKKPKSKAGNAALPMQKKSRITPKLEPEDYTTADDPKCFPFLGRVARRLAPEGSADYDFNRRCFENLDRNEAMLLESQYKNVHSDNARLLVQSMTYTGQLVKLALKP